MDNHAGDTRGKGHWKKVARLTSTEKGKSLRSHRIKRGKSHGERRVSSKYFAGEKNGERLGQWEKDAAHIGHSKEMLDVGLDS